MNLSFSKTLRMPPVSGFSSKELAEAGAAREKKNAALRLQLADAAEKQSKNFKQEGLLATIGGPTLVQDIQHLKKRRLRFLGRQEEKKSNGVAIWKEGVELERARLEIIEKHRDALAKIVTVQDDQRHKSNHLFELLQPQFRLLEPPKWAEVLRRVEDEDIQRTFPFIDGQSISDNGTNSFFGPPRVTYNSDFDTGSNGTEFTLNSSLRMRDTSDRDWAWFHHFVCLGFMFRMPTRGFPQVGYRVRIKENHRELLFHDEWGFSSAQIGQRMALVSHVTGPDPVRIRTGILDAFNEIYSLDSVIPRDQFHPVPQAEMIPSGTEFHLIDESPEIWNEGDLLFIGIGAVHQSTLVTDDMGLNSALHANFEILECRVNVIEDD